MRVQRILTVSVNSAKPADREEVERLIAAYHESEGIRPRPERIRWAVDQCLNGTSPGVLLVARNGERLVGVVPAAYSISAELGRVMDVNDF